jgi:hypothetical protein
LRPKEAVNPQKDGGVAVATRTQPIVVRVPHDERHESFVEIFVRKGEQRLVTHVELLSWANKSPGEHGRDLYLRKQREILTSKAHLVEIDLLRGGKHTTAVPLERAQAEAGSFDYHVCVHRFDNLEDYFLYPIRLEDRLPEIAVPLLPGDGSVAVDLQAVFNRCYDSGPYRRLIRYGVEDLERGLEADQCFYLTHEPLVRNKQEIDLAADPPPDFTIAIDVTRSSKTRLGIYAALGVPEVWRFDGASLVSTSCRPTASTRPSSAAGISRSWPGPTWSASCSRARRWTRTPWCARSGTGCASSFAPAANNRNDVPSAGLARTVQDQYPMTRSAVFQR